MTRKLFIAIILFVLTITGKLIIDLNLYYSGGVNNHTLGAAMVVICLVACTLLAGWRSSVMWFFGFWALFDSLWGLFTGNGFLYLGTTAWLDQLQKEHHWIQIAKYVLAVAGTAWYVLKSRENDK